MRWGASVKSKIETKNFWRGVVTWLGTLVIIAAVGALVWLTMPPIEESVWTLDGTESGFAPPKMPAKTWTEWAYHFQALIGGVFAVVAAFVTVSQMRASDLSAEERHTELLNRQDDVGRNRAERFLNPAYEELCRTEDWASRRIPEIQSDFSADFPALRNIIDAVQTSVGRPQFANAEDLLDGKGAAALVMLLAAAAEAPMAIQRLSNAVGSNSGETTSQNRNLGSVLGNLRLGLQDLIQGMERVADRHGINIQRPRSSHVNNNDDGISIGVESTAMHQ
jgi:hypothetical protein